MFQQPKSLRFYINFFLTFGKFYAIILTYIPFFKTSK